MRRWLILAVTVLLMATAHAQTNAQLRDSLAEAVEKLNRYPDNIDLRLRKASWNLLFEQWDYAQREYDQVLARDSDNVAALYFRAYAYERMYKYDFARKDYERMLKIVPGNFNGQLGLALLNQKDMRYTEAMNIINHLVEQFPDSAEAYAARAGMEQERGMMEVAEYDFSQAIRLEPDNVDFLLSRADLLIKMGRKNEARRDLDTAVAKGVPKPSLADMYAKCR